ncbi:MAG: hypothetical protein ABH849_00770 [Nanoarchaeota archaeon]
MAEPQLVVLNDGKLVPSELIPYSENRFLGFDVRRSSKPIGDPIDLELIASISMGERRFNELIGELTVEKDVFEEKDRQIFSYLSYFEGEAKKLAQEAGVPYFGLDLVKNSVWDVVQLGLLPKNDCSI